MNNKKPVGIKTDLVKAPIMRDVSREVNGKTLAELETDHALVLKSRNKIQELLLIALMNRIKNMDASQSLK